MSDRNAMNVVTEPEALVENRKLPLMEFVANWKRSH